MASEASEDDEDEFLTQGDIQDTHDIYGSIHQTDSGERRNAEADSKRLDGFSQEALLEDYVTEGGLIVRGDKEVRFDVNNNNNAALLKPPNAENADEISRNQDDSSAFESRQRPTHIQKRYSITGTSAIRASPVFQRRSQKNGNQKESSVSPGQKEKSNGEGGSRRYCGLSFKKCWILWVVFLIACLIIIATVLLVIFTTNSKSETQSKSEKETSANSNPPSKGETAALVDPGNLTHAKEEHIKTHYALVGDRPEDDCSLGNHQSPIRIERVGVKDGLRGQTINFNLIQSLRSTSLFGHKLMLVSNSDRRLFFAGFRSQKIEIKISNFTLPPSSIIDSPLTRYGFNEEDVSTFRLEYVDLWWPSLHVMETSSSSPSAPSDLEFHLVFVNADGDDLRHKYLIVAALGTARSADDALSAADGRTTTDWPLDEVLISALTRLSRANAKTSENATWVDIDVDVQKAVAAEATNLWMLFEEANDSRQRRRHPFYVYEGSLPNPPCTEGAFWLIHRRQFSFSQKLKEKLKKFLFPGVNKDRRGRMNRRPPQDLNGRPVVKIDLP